MRWNSSRRTSSSRSLRDRSGCANACSPLKSAAAPPAAPSCRSLRRPNKDAGSAAPDRSIRLGQVGVIAEDIRLALHFTVRPVKRGRRIGLYSERPFDRAVILRLRPAHLITVAEQGCEIGVQDAPLAVFLDVIDVIRTPDPAGRSVAPDRARGEPMAVCRAAIARHFDIGVHRHVQDEEARDLASRRLEIAKYGADPLEPSVDTAIGELERHVGSAPGEALLRDSG